MKKLLVILGPTATGKTDIALHMAKKFNGELVACDSRQVYKRLDIGTGKLPDARLVVKKKNKYWIVDEVGVWMYDVVSLEKRYTVADYVKDAQKIIDEIRKRRKLPIVVGGTGLYIKALLEGLASLSVPINRDLRKKLEKLTTAQLQIRLQQLSESKWNSMNDSDRNNRRRLIRYIELILMHPYRKKIQYSIGKVADQKLNVLKIGLTASKEILYEKINNRVHNWVKEGIIKEVKTFFKRGISRKRIKELGLEYRVIVEYLDNQISMEGMIKKMQVKTRQYAKRQVTWFKKEKNILWFDIQGKNYLEQVEKQIAKWYHFPNDSKN